MNQLKVALDARYVQNHFPGIGRYTYSLAEALAALPNAPQLTLIYNPALPDSSYNIAQLAEKYPQNVRLLSTEVRPFSIAEQWKLFNPVRQAKFDVWHAPYYLRPYWLPVPSVVNIHDLIGLRMPEALPSRKARYILDGATRLAILSSTKIISGSEAAALDIQKMYKVSPQKITVVLNGVSEQFKPLTVEEQIAFRTRLQLPEKYLLHVGINKPHKNQARLLQAFKQFHDRTGLTEYKLILAGRADSRYTPELLSLTEQLDLTPHVKFWQNVPEAELRNLYASASLFVFPSLLEGFGLPVLEAMACGTPVICADNTSLPEVAGTAAYYFKAEDSAEMSRQISLALGDAAELRQKSMQQAAKFTWQKAAERTLTVYESAKTKS